MHLATYLRYIRRMSAAEQTFWSMGTVAGDAPGRYGADAEYGWS
jgi:hypothetical protein